MKEFKLGSKLKDLASGLTGITTAKVQYLNGCTQYNINPKVEKDNKMKESWYIDAQQLEDTKEKTGLKPSELISNVVFELGSKLKDKVTGFTGIASSRITFINGFIRYGLVAKVDKENKLSEMQYFGVDNLDYVNKPIKVNQSNTGGPSVKCKF